MTLSLGCSALGGRNQIAEQVRVAESMTRIADEVRASVAEIRTAVEAVQTTGDKSTAQAGGLNYASAYGFGAAVTVIGSMVALAFLCYKIAEWSHVRELKRLDLQCVLGASHTTTTP